MQEFWQPARYYYPQGLDYDIHNPYTDSFNNIMVRNWKGTMGLPAFSPDQQNFMKVV